MVRELGYVPHFRGARLADFAPLVHISAYMALIQLSVVLADKAAFRAQLEQLAKLPRLAHVVVSHHQVIADDPAGTLARIAATL